MLRRPAILFDKFHVMRHLGEALDQVRKSEYARLRGRDRSLIKGQKYTLLSHRDNPTLGGLRCLHKLLQRLNVAYLLKESFEQLWGSELADRAAARLRVGAATQGKALSAACSGHTSRTGRGSAFRENGDGSESQARALSASEIGWQGQLPSRDQARKSGRRDSGGGKTAPRELDRNGDPRPKRPGPFHAREGRRTGRKSSVVSGADSQSESETH